MTTRIKNRLNRVETRIRAGIPTVERTPVEAMMDIAESILDATPHWRTATPDDLSPEEYADAQQMLATAAADWEQMRYWKERGTPLPEMTIDEINGRVKQLLREARERERKGATS